MSSASVVVSPGRYEPITVKRKKLSVDGWSEKCLHVFSVGNNELLFEVWINPETADLVLRCMDSTLWLHVHTRKVLI